MLSHAEFTRWLEDRHHLHDATLRAIKCEHLCDCSVASRDCSFLENGRRVLIEVLIPVDDKPNDYVKTCLLFGGVNSVRFSFQAGDYTDTYIIRSLVKLNKDGGMTFGIYGELFESGEWHYVKIMVLACRFVGVSEYCLPCDNKEDGEG